MPELPEVEIIRGGLLRELPGRRVLDLHWSGKGLRHSMPIQALRQYLPGACVNDITRRAKYLLFRMDNGAVLLVHLGMSGKLVLLDGAGKRDRHDHLCLLLDDKRELRFNDSRRFGDILLWPPDQARQMEAALCAREGIEPFADDFTAAHLARLAANRRVAIKAFLMNSRIIAGIGNIYANEILFAAAIHPESPACALTIEHWRRITRQSRRILKKAIEAGGSTIADFLDANGYPGSFQSQFKVYGKNDQPCCRCSTKLRKLLIGGRSTFFCPGCQK